MPQTPHRLTALTAALVLSLPGFASAQSQTDANAELLRELRALREQVSEMSALRERVAQLEAKQRAIEAKGDSGQWGMTPAQSAQLGRVAVKVEGIEDAREASGLQGLKISGQMQPAYIVNQAQNTAGFQFLDSSAYDANGFNYWNGYVGVAILDFQKEMAGGTKWRLTLAPQNGAGVSLGANSIIWEASVSVPLTDLQTRFIAGQIPDWSGYEYAQPMQNKLITHNLLFDFTLPTAYIGAGLELARDKWTVKTVYANMNQNNNPTGESGGVLALRADYYGGEFMGWGLAGVVGRAPNFVNPTDNTGVGLIEVDGYYIRGNWTLQGQLSYGMQKQAAITADPATGAYRNASWYGLSALAAYKFTPTFEGMARFDAINNARNGGGLLGYGADYRNGIGPDGNLGCATAYVNGCDQGANRYALSLGLNYAFNDYTQFKLEYRYDWSNLAVFNFVTDDSYRKYNNVLGAAVVVGF